MNQDSCCRKEITVHVSTDTGMRGKQRNCILEVNNFGGGSVMMQGSISYAEKLNWCTGICRHVYSNFFSAA
jgi:hypothetical protein